MQKHLANDLRDLRALLEQTLDAAYQHLDTIETKPPATERLNLQPLALPEEGFGGEQTLATFSERYGRLMAASAGPRYWGFVTGGTTPAALMGDWLVSAFDVNLADRNNSDAPNIEIEVIRLLCELFGLPESFTGVFVSGATTSNFVSLAMGREWVSQQEGYSAAQDGLYGKSPIKVLSAAPHSSVIKSLAMLGMGRNSVVTVGKLPDNREAVDIVDLQRQLAALNGAPCVVIANAGTVNTVDFDDIRAIAALKGDYPFWLHVDAAFGGFAACSPHYQHLLDGLELADSITIDAHKWLNVPYDSAMIFTRHQTLQASVFQNLAAYLPDIGAEPDFFHLTPENSRRFRALPAWFSLMAYGKAGYRDIVERNCATATLLGEKISASTQFELLAPVRMNVVCFTLTGERSTELMQQFITALRDDGRVFLTPTVYQGVAGLRAAFCNWRTQEADVEHAWVALIEVAEGLSKAMVAK